MKSSLCWVSLSITLFCSMSVVAQQASFTTPDTVCINEPVNIVNTSTGGTAFYWNFCAGSLYQSPEVTNFGNPGSAFNIPVFAETAKEGNDYYTFVINNGRSLVRMAFGNSLLNTPTIQNLGDFSGAIPPQTEGLQIVNDAAGWHIIIVGGGNATTPSIAKLDFGSSLANIPSATNWGNIGQMAYPVDLYMFQDGGRWYGLTVNADNNSITRLDFGTSFNTAPTGINLGNIGNLDFPTGIYPAKVNNNWYVFVTNAYGNTITRLDFGTSLLNTPTAVNLGNPGNLLNTPRDIYIINECDNLFGLVANGDGNDILRLDFAGGSITGAVTGTSYGSLGNSFDYPHSLSSVFRVKDDLYTYVANARRNNVVRLKFSSCTNSSIPSSNLRTPATYTYTKAGTYTINMIMDEGLPTQQATCRTIVVVAPPVVDLGNNQITTCNGAPVLLDAGAGFSYYKWSDNSTGRTLVVNASGTYSVEVGSGGGCKATDQVTVNISPVMNATATATDIDCHHPGGTITVNASGGTPPYTYALNGVNRGAVSNFTGLTAGNYTIVIRDVYGCTITRTATVATVPNSVFDISGNSTAPSCNGDTDGEVFVNVNNGPSPYQFSFNGAPYQYTTASTISYSNLASGTYTIYGEAANGCYDTIKVTVAVTPVLDLAIVPRDEICDQKDGSIFLNINGGTAPFAFTVNGVPATDALLQNLVAGDYYIDVVDSKGCTASTSATLDNLRLPPVTITNNDTTIVIGAKVELHAINAVDYAWTPVTAVSCVDCATIIAQPMEKTTYIVTTATGLNCVKSDTVTIFVDRRSSFFIPNAFTPNKDGVNDVFRPKAQGIAAFNMVIYNRWGEVVYITNDVSKGWDGYYKQQLQPSGGYVYRISYVTYVEPEKVHEEKGIVTLIR